MGIPNLSHETMGITVEGQKCPVCSAYLFDSDDVVFCPDCGAPHHRDCYAAIGHCGLQADHGTERQYHRPAPKDRSETVTAPQPKADASEAEQTTEKLCPSCGSRFEGKGNICPYCGRPIGQGFTPFGTPIAAFDPMGGVGRDETIEEIPATEVRDYVTVNTPRYLPRFQKLHGKKRISWNWAAFVFPHAWFFYRKIYFPGIFFFLLTVMTSAMTSALNLVLDTMPDEALMSYQAMYQYIADNITAFDPTLIALSMVGFFLGLIVRVAAAMSGDWLYRSSALARIRKIKETPSEEELPLALQLRKGGSVSPALGMIGLFALRWAVYLIFLIL